MSHATQAASSYDNTVVQPGIYPGVHGSLNPNYQGVMTSDAVPQSSRSANQLSKLSPNAQSFVPRNFSVPDFQQGQQHIALPPQFEGQHHLQQQQQPQPQQQQQQQQQQPHQQGPDAAVGDEIYQVSPPQGYEGQYENGYPELGPQPNNSTDGYPPPQQPPDQQNNMVWIMQPTPPPQYFYAPPAATPMFMDPYTGYPPYHIPQMAPQQMMVAPNYYQVPQMAPMPPPVELQPPSISYEYGPVMEGGPPMVGVGQQPQTQMSFFPTVTYSTEAAPSPYVTFVNGGPPEQQSTTVMPIFSANPEMAPTFYDPVVTTPVIEQIFDAEAQPLVAPFSGGMSYQPQHQKPITYGSYSYPQQALSDVDVSETMLQSQQSDDFITSPSGTDMARSPRDSSSYLAPRFAKQRGAGHNNSHHTWQQHQHYHEGQQSSNHLGGDGKQKGSKKRTPLLPTPRSNESQQPSRKSFDVDFENGDDEFPVMTGRHLEFENQTLSKEKRQGERGPWKGKYGTSLSAANSVQQNSVAHDDEHTGLRDFDADDVSQKRGSNEAQKTVWDSIGLWGDNGPHPALASATFSYATALKGPKDQPPAAVTVQDVVDDTQRRLSQFQLQEEQDRRDSRLAADAHHSYPAAWGGPEEHEPERPERGGFQRYDQQPSAPQEHRGGYRGRGSGVGPPRGRGKRPPQPLNLGDFISGDRLPVANSSRSGRGTRGNGGGVTRGGGSASTIGRSESSQQHLERGGFTKGKDTGHNSIEKSGGRTSKSDQAGNVLDASQPVFHRGKQREAPKKRCSTMRKVINREREQSRSASANEERGTASTDSGTDTLPDPIRQRLHSARFRDYCENVVNQEVDTAAKALLSELRRYQDRVYAKDPVKGRIKRRTVVGLRETLKQLRVEKIKCVVIAPDIEQILSKGGLDDTINQLLAACKQQNIPYVFAMSKMALGYCTHKHGTVSAVGVVDYSGAEAQFRTLVETAERMRIAYEALITRKREELIEMGGAASSKGSLTEEGAESSSSADGADLSGDGDSMSVCSDVEREASEGF